MRSIWLIFGFLLITLLGLGFYLRRPTARPGASHVDYSPPIVLASQRSAGVPAGPPPADTLRAGIVRFALGQRGIPYLYAGSSPATGFDCSGFLQYVYGHFGVATPHSTALLISAGRPVPRAQAQPGDLVVFTGTAEGSTTPGHAGIVISAPGETPLRFVHASSARRESGVKISQVENSGYERRFMQVRRVLGLGAGSLTRVPAIAARPGAAITRPPAAVAALPAAPATAVAVPATPLPAKVAPVAVRLRSRPAATPLRTKAKAGTHTAAARQSARKVSARKPAKAQATTLKAGKTSVKKPTTKKIAKPAAKFRKSLNRI
jgi:hypothetical protein